MQDNYLLVAYFQNVIRKYATKQNLELFLL